MQVFAVLCLAAVALARPQTGYNYNHNQAGHHANHANQAGGVTTVTERTFTVKGGSDNSKSYGSAGAVGGISSFSNGVSGISSYSATPAPAFDFAATAAPALSASFATAAPAFNSFNYAAAPAISSYSAAPAFNFAAAAAPAVNFPAASFSAAPAFNFQAAPAISSFSAAPAFNFQAAPAISSYSAAPPINYQAAAGFPSIDYKPAFSGFDQTQFNGAEAETKVYKHVYAFAAPEEPATRARISVQAPVTKRKHYKLVFIKAPSQETSFDSDITIPAQEEEKTLIYLLSKDRKQAQPEIRIKQAEAAKHAKPEVYFLKYKTEQEAQAIANGAISGQTADVPANGEIISDGSVSILGQAQEARASFAPVSTGIITDSSFRSFAAPASASFAAPATASFAAPVGNFGFNAGFAAQSAAAPAASYAATGRSFNFGTSGTGAASTSSLTSSATSGASSGASSGTSSGISAAISTDNQEPASAALESSEASVETATAGALTF